VSLGSVHTGKCVSDGIADARYVNEAIDRRDPVRQRGNVERDFRDDQIEAGRS
jgi:hypothetical protein